MNKSKRIRSGPNSASRPATRRESVVASTLTYPACSRARWRSQTFAGSSSTTRIRASSRGLPSSMFTHLSLLSAGLPHRLMQESVEPLAVGRPPLACLGGRILAFRDSRRDSVTGWETSRRRSLRSGRCCSSPRATMDGLQDLLCGIPLRHIPEGAGPQHREDRVPILVCGECNHPGGRRTPPDLTCGPLPSAAGHANVQERHVWELRSCHLDSALRVLRSPDESQGWVGRD